MRVFIHPSIDNRTDNNPPERKENTAQLVYNVAWVIMGDGEEIIGGDTGGIRADN